MGISIDDDFFDNPDVDNDNVGMYSDTESVAPSIEQSIEIKNRVHGMCFILS
jgi:hypothetical protein